MLFEILKPIKDYIVADTFKEAVKIYIKKHEENIRNIDNIEITDHIKTEIFHTQYSSKKNNFKIIKTSSMDKILSNNLLDVPSNLITAPIPNIPYSAPPPSYSIAPPSLQTQSLSPIKPTLPISQPTLPISQPTLPISQPTLPIKPTLPISQPTLPISQPTLPISQPTLPISQPTLPISPNKQVLPMIENSEYLTTENIDNIYTRDKVPIFNKKYFNETILPKIQNYDKKINKNHIIEGTKYEYIYATSDIHADFRKFAQILISSGLIDCPINPYEDVYNSKIISESKWIKENTLFIIIGDLVDGKRDPYYDGVDGDVLDNIGSFELLLHLFIYNLRIKANEKNSNILFTIGNHDYYNLIDGKIDDAHEPEDLLYYTYIHRNVKNFFTIDPTKPKDWINERVDTLTPFYNLSPYLFLRIDNDDIIFVHAGLHHNSKDVNTVELMLLNQIQLSINMMGLQQGLINNDNLATAEEIFTTRFHREYGVNKDGTVDAVKRKELCDTITNELGLNLLVVGHCPTIFNNIYNRIELDKKTNSTYKNCDTGNYGYDDEETKGCTFQDCTDKDGIPRLIYVDTGSSLAFRNTDYTDDVKVQSDNIKSNKLRGVEILKLLHSDKIVSKRHFNVMHRFVLFSDNNQDIKIFPK